MIGDGIRMSPETREHGDPGPSGLRRTCKKRLLALVLDHLSSCLNQSIVS